MQLRQRRRRRQPNNCCGNVLCPLSPSLSLSITLTFPFTLPPLPLTTATKQQHHCGWRCLPACELNSISTFPSPLAATSSLSLPQTHSALLPFLCSSALHPPSSPVASKFTTKSIFKSFMHVERQQQRDAQCRADRKGEGGGGQGIGSPRLQDLNLSWPKTAHTHTDTD